LRVKTLGVVESKVRKLIEIEVSDKQLNRNRLSLAQLISRSTSMSSVFNGRLFLDLLFCKHLTVCSTGKRTQAREMTDGNCIDSIELPTDQIFSDLTNAKRFAIDIGE
jgi:hypothetical protein